MFNAYNSVIKGMMLAYGLVEFLFIYNYLKNYLSCSLHLSLSLRPQQRPITWLQWQELKTCTVTAWSRWGPVWFWHPQVSESTEPQVPSQLCSSSSDLRREQAVHGPRWPGAMPWGVPGALCALLPLCEENGRRGVLSALPEPAGGRAGRVLQQILQKQRQQKHLQRRTHACHAVPGHVHHLRGVRSHGLHWFKHLSRTG